MGAEFSTVQRRQTPSQPTDQTGGRLRARSADFSYPGCSRNRRKALAGGGPRVWATAMQSRGGAPTARCHRQIVGEVRTAARRGCRGQAQLKTDGKVHDRETRDHRDGAAQ
jgi:hypothetical protein